MVQHHFGERTEEDLARAAEKRKLVESAEGEPHPILMPLDDVILPAELDLLRDKSSPISSSNTFEDHLKALGDPVFGLELIGRIEVLVIAVPGIEGAVLLDFEFTLTHLRRADILIQGDDP